MLVRLLKVGGLAALTTAAITLSLLLIAFVALQIVIRYSSGIGQIAVGGLWTMASVAIIFCLAFWYFWQRN